MIGLWLIRNNNKRRRKVQSVTPVLSNETAANGRYTERILIL